MGFARKNWNEIDEEDCGGNPEISSKLGGHCKNRDWCDDEEQIASWDGYERREQRLDVIANREARPLEREGLG